MRSASGLKMIINIYRVLMLWSESEMLNAHFRATLILSSNERSRGQTYAACSILSPLSISSYSRNWQQL